MQESKCYEYQSPQAFVLEVWNEGVLCASNEKVDEIEGEW